MMINDAIADASSEHTIYFLLTAYLDTLQLSRKLPEHLTVSPITGLQDMESRFEKLVAEYETEIRLPDSSKFFVLIEAVHIFDIAAIRLCQLMNEVADQNKVRGRSPDHHPVFEVHAV
jgi:hypothetical protein